MLITLDLRSKDGTVPLDSPNASCAGLQPAVIIRPYAPEDCEAVKEIFATGMLGLIPQLTKDALKAPAAQAACAAVPGIPLAIAFTCGAPLYATTLAVLLAALALPSAALAYMHHVMHSYVAESIAGDLKDIYTYYSDKGAGPGSAFWVACMPQQAAESASERGRSNNTKDSPASPPGKPGKGLSRFGREHHGVADADSNPCASVSGDSSSGIGSCITGSSLSLGYSSGGGASSAAGGGGSSDGSGKMVVVGHVALEWKSDEEAELRRMSVQPGYRRHGIAASLCETLLAHARTSGFKRVILSTSSAQRPAQALYKRMGWIEERVSGHPSGAVSFHHLVHHLDGKQDQDS